MFELQGKWVAAVLSGRVSLPSQDEMMEDTKAFYDKLEASGIPKRYTHLMPDDSQVRTRFLPTTLCYLDKMK